MPAVKGPPMMERPASLQPRKVQGYGWRPDLPDRRDHLFSEVHREAVEPPPSVDLLPYLPPVFDQGQLGSCVGNATGLLHAHVLALEPRSRLEIYYEARKLEGDTGQDAGCEIRDAMKVLATLGAGAEALWPYDIAKFARHPPAREMRDAAQHKAVTYSRLITRQDFRECLAAGFPFAIGFSVYDAFESQLMADTGVLNLPQRGERMLGGHAVLVAGYDTAFASSEWGRAAAALGARVPNDVYLVRNSWSESWGRDGNFAVDAAYFEDTSLADDAWTMRP